MGRGFGCAVRLIGLALAPAFFGRFMHAVLLQELDVAEALGVREVEDGLACRVRRAEAHRLFCLRAVGHAQKAEMTEERRRSLDELREPERAAESSLRSGAERAWRGAPASLMTVESGKHAVADDVEDARVVAIDRRA